MAPKHDGYDTLANIHLLQRHLRQLGEVSLAPPEARVFRMAASFVAKINDRTESLNSERKEQLRALLNRIVQINQKIEATKERLQRESAADYLEESDGEKTLQLAASQNSEDESSELVLPSPKRP